MPGGYEDVRGVWGEFGYGRKKRVGRERGKGEREGQKTKHPIIVRSEYSFGVHQKTKV